MLPDRSLSEVERRFGARGIRWCDMLLFDVRAALEVIEECRKNSIPVLGIEGFVPFGEPDLNEKVLSDTADILDTSSPCRSEATTYDVCRSFVSDPKREGMHFEFVFGD